MENFKRESMRGVNGTKVGKVEAIIAENSKELFDNFCKLNGKHILTRQSKEH
jgi:hypothetical protein